jgi:GSCFA family
VISNPYGIKPDISFWKKSVALPAMNDVDPVVRAKVRIGSDSSIATAGSCFAQHIARTLVKQGQRYLIIEDAPAFEFCDDENYGTFSARYGNIYTARQLLQLFYRAYNLFEPVVGVWQRADGRFIDPFRPQIQSGGYGTPEQLAQDREAHLAAVRLVFETCDVFVFTLGLTEGWLSNEDGAVYPLAPGVVSPYVSRDQYRFHNFNVAQVEADLELFFENLRKVNPSVKVILTVSPVPLIATYTDEHVLTATAYSKAVLRAVAGSVSGRHDYVDYFPSFEMITGAHTRGRFYEEDLREVNAEGVAYVMSKFSHHYLSDAVQLCQPVANAAISEEDFRRQRAVLETLSKVICEEIYIENNL